MLKIKEVEVFSYDTVRTGFEAYFKTFFLSIPLLAVPIGFLVYFNLAGWVATGIYGGERESPKFFSQENFVVGWGVTWRYYIFVLPFLLLSILSLFLDQVISIPKYIDAIMFIAILLSSSILATGWSVGRVAIVRRRARELDGGDQRHATPNIVKSVVDDSWTFFKKYWPKLLVSAVVTYGAFRAITIFMIPETFFSTKNDDIVPLLLDWMIERIGPATLIPTIGASILGGIIMQVAIKDAKGESITFLDAIKKLLPKLPIILIVGLLSEVLAGMGLILLVVPGIIISIWFCFVVPIVVAEEIKGVINIFRRSKYLIKGYFWQVILLLLFSLIVGFVLTVVSDSINMIPGVKILESGVASQIRSYIESIAMALVSSLFVTFAYLKLAGNSQELVETS